MFTVPGALAFYSCADGSRETQFSHLESLPADRFARLIPGFGHGSIRDTLVHIATMERAWRDGVLGAHAPAPALGGATLPDVRALFEDNSALTRAFVAEITDQEMSAYRVVRLPWSGTRCRVCPGWVLLHVVTHEFHHRGQVAAMCRSLGAPVPDLRLGLPAMVAT
jgi:uncharacterized damage-inducible protein DinB